METKIYNLVILDESGSMSSIEKQALDGVNETFQSIAEAEKVNEDQKHFISFVTFNSAVDKKLECVPASKLPKIKRKDYVPYGCTALLDAMGFALNDLKKHVNEDDRVLVTIVTDGMENASREFDYSSIKKIVEDLKKNGWVFTFMGANQNLDDIVENLSISNVMQFESTQEGTEHLFAEERELRRCFYNRMSTDAFDSVAENKSFFKRKKH